jgi:hypothetical protein
MTLSSKPLAILVVVILFGGILLSSVLGLWNTTSTKVAAKYTQGEFAGQANPADIRGSYTLGDIEKNFGIAPQILVKAFTIQTDDPAAFQVKELETQYAGSPVAIGTSSVRLFVALYNGLPFDLSTDIYLPSEAVELLKGRTLSTDQLTYLGAHTAGSSQVASSTSTLTTPIPLIPTTAPTITAVSSSDRTIKGLTTFNDLLSWGLPNAAIEKILGLSLPSDLTMKIKDFASANNLNFETLKPALQSAVDSLK